MRLPEDSSTKPPDSEMTRQADFELRDDSGLFEDRDYTDDEDLALEHKFDKSTLDKSDNQEALGRLSNYDLLRVLGSGGMGVVFQAFDNRLGRVVALKVLNRQLLSSPIAKRRFMREARAAAAIKHDNVVTIHAVEEHNHCPFLVMEFVHGDSLRELIRRQGALSPTDALKLAAQIAAGLAAAHAQGVIHRDIKPANILLEDSLFRAKLSDFGLARAAFDNAELTGAGLVVGTPAYMSPEQILGNEIDPRADLFSLGCVMYAMLAGHSPFHGTSYFEVSRNVTDFRPTALHTLNPQIPRFLSDMVGKLLEKSPDDRPQSAAEVSLVLTRHIAQINKSPSDRIDRMLHEQPTDVWKTRNRSRRLQIVSMLFTLVALLSILFAWMAGKMGDMPITVDGAGFPNLADALVAAKAGSVIHISKPGTYEGPIKISGSEFKGLKIVGTDNVVIAAPGVSDSVVQLENVSGVTLEKMIINSGKQQHGIELQGNCEGTKIDWCEVRQDTKAQLAAVYLHNGASGTQDAHIQINNTKILFNMVGLVLGGEMEAEMVENIDVSGCTIQGVKRYPDEGVSLSLSSPLAHINISGCQLNAGVAALGVVCEPDAALVDVALSNCHLKDFTKFLWLKGQQDLKGLLFRGNEIGKVKVLLEFDRESINKFDSTVDLRRKKAEIEIRKNNSVDEAEREVSQTN